VLEADRECSRRSRATKHANRTSREPQLVSRTADVGILLEPNAKPPATSLAGQRRQHQHRNLAKASIEMPAGDALRSSRKIARERSRRSRGRQLADESEAIHQRQPRSRGRRGGAADARRRRGGLGDGQCVLEPGDPRPSLSSLEKALQHRSIALTENGDHQLPRVGIDIRPPRQRRADPACEDARVEMTLSGGQRLHRSLP
jgi:hypothetical protein